MGTHLLRLSRLRLRGSGLCAATQSPEQVDFPAGPRAHVVLGLIPLKIWKMTRDSADRAFERLVNSRGLCRQVRCRQELRAGFARCRPRLLDASNRSGKIEILMQGALNDASELGIVEPEPPPIERRSGRSRAAGLYGGSAVEALERDGGPPVVGSYGAPAETQPRHHGHHDDHRWFTHCPNPHGPLVTRRRATMHALRAALPARSIGSPHPTEAAGWIQKPRFAPSASSPVHRHERRSTPARAAARTLARRDSN